MDLEHYSYSAMQQRPYVAVRTLLEHIWQQYSYIATKTRPCVSPLRKLKASKKLRTLLNAQNTRQTGKTTSG